jgi:hypothetical protein
MKQISCFCENKFDIDYPDEIRLEDRPDIFSEIKNGTFLNFTCPKCSRVLKPLLPFHFIINSKNTDIFVVPETDRAQWLGGKLDAGKADRVVLGYEEFVEKLQLISDGLDDRAVELIKLYFIEKADSENELDIYYRQQEGDSLVFHISGLKENETAVAKVPLSQYQKICTNIKDKAWAQDYKELITPPYVSVKKIYHEK